MSHLHGGLLFLEECGDAGAGEELVDGGAVFVAQVGVGVADPLQAFGLIRKRLLLPRFAVDFRFERVGAARDRRVARRAGT
jgi:hypothetical protein